MVLFVDTVAVVGAGTMGARIAELFALNSKHVLLHDAQPGAVDKALVSIRASLDALARFHETKAERAIAGIEKDHNIQLTEDQRKAIQAKQRPTYTNDRVDEAFARIQPVDSVEDLAPAELAIEAIIEDARAKTTLFQSLGKHLDSRAILATNTSALAISPLAEASGRPQRFLGLHFFNPPTTLPLVEVIPAAKTDPQTVEDAVNLLATMRNHRYPMAPIPVKECPGFLVNRILGAMLTEAYRCLEENVASARDIDNAMKFGAGFPMGPLELSDLIGLDVIEHAHANARDGLKAYSDYVAEPNVLAQLVKEGRLGRKAGKGFFEYT